MNSNFRKLKIIQIGILIYSVAVHVQHINRIEMLIILLFSVNATIYSTKMFLFLVKGIKKIKEEVYFSYFIDRFSFGCLKHKRT